MSTPSLTERKRYISFPAADPRPSAPRRALRHVLGLCLMPVALLAAWRRRAPGLRVRVWCIGLGLRALASGRLRHAFVLVANPMDSFRYFEFDFVSRATSHLRPLSYLDVSSPRLVPLMMLDRHRGLVADVLNPIASDLAETTDLARALGFSHRCRSNPQLIEDTAYADASFDLVTSISVVEHIPDDSIAIATMWRLVRPGGCLLITVPCAREACEEFANLDEYGLLAKDAAGFVYWQRYYDQALLAQRIWSITGAPVRTRIFGEVKPGSYDENVAQKRTRADYPYWKEPLMMGRDYRNYESLDQLPGMGVIAMEFIKQAGVTDD